MAEIVPTILTNDISDFRKKYTELFALSHYFKKLHIDFIDGEYIANKTVMPKDLAFLKSSPLTLIAHFMVYKPHLYFQDVKDANFSTVLVQYEAYEKDSDLSDDLNLARSMGMKIGISINPETPLFAIAKFLNQVDLVQLMSIHPGAQGRPFIFGTINKIKELRFLSRNVIISVDGGVKVGIARQCVKAGADLLVAGAAILCSEDEEMAVEVLKADIEI